MNILTFKTLKKFKKNNFEKKMSNKELEKNIIFIFLKKKSSLNVNILTFKTLKKNQKNVFPKKKSNKEMDIENLFDSF